MLANSVQNITTKAGTQLWLLTIYTNIKKKFHEAQFGNHSLCTWFSEKEKSKGLVALSET
jgi:hypothetical protein